MPREILAKTILNKTKRRDPWFLDDYTINPYSGCSFNCLYCYIRGSKYGANMEEKLSVKVNGPDLLEKQLKNRAKKGQYGFIVLSSATDPYLQVEREHELTRRMLEIILHYRFPVHIITKSDLVVRDFDLLHEINEQAILSSDLASQLKHKTLVTFSFSTLDHTLGKIFEPGAPTPTVRLETLKTTLAAGFHSGVSLMPLLPYLTDTEEHLTHMFSTFKDIGVNYLFPASITLFGSGPSDSKTLVLQAVAKHFPQLLEEYKKLFIDGYQLPQSYEISFDKRVKAMCQQFNIKTSIQ